MDRIGGNFGGKVLELRASKKQGNGDCCMIIFIICNILWRVLLWYSQEMDGYGK